MPGSAFAHPLINQVVGVSEEEQDPRIMQRAAAFQRAQQQGVIPTMSSFPAAGKYLNSFGLGGPITVNPYEPRVRYRPEDFTEGGLTPPLDDPNYTDINGEKGGPKRNNPYGLDPTTYGLLEYMKDQKETPEEYAEKLRVFEDFALRRAQQQQKFGLQSNLAGFALKELPRIFTEPARRRNRYLDDLVLGIQDQRLAAGALTGGAVGDYRI